MTIVPIGFGSAVLKWSVNGLARTMTSTIGYQPATPGTVADQAAAVKAGMAVTGGLGTVGMMLQDWSFDGVDVTYMGILGPQLGSAAGTGVGTLVANSLPVNCTMLVKKTTNRGGRKGRGRMFLPACYLAETSVSNIGGIGAGEVTRIQNALDATFDEWLAQDLTMYLLHDDETEPDEITSLSVQGFIATQRRRLR